MSPDPPQGGPADDPEEQAAGDLEGTPDAEVTEVTDLDERQAAPLAAEREITTKNVALTRETMRCHLAYGVLATTAGVGLAVILSGALGGSDTQVLVSVFTGLLGLAGTIVGFYFGGKDSTG